jgi:hypothetical protein
VLVYERAAEYVLQCRCVSARRHTSHPNNSRVVIKRIPPNNSSTASTIAFSIKGFHPGNILDIISISVSSTMAPSIKDFHPENIPGIVSNLRLNGTTASFCFGTADRPLSGKQCLVYAVQFPDGATWAVRVPTQANHLQPEAVTAHVEMEVYILKRVEASGFSRSPRLLGYNSGFDNPLGFPYIVSTWIEGTTAKWSDSIPSDRDTRNKFLRQVADITLELADCTGEWRKAAVTSPRFSHAPSLPVWYTGPTTASTHLTDSIDRKIVRVSNGQLPGIQLRDCFIQRALVPEVVHFPLEKSPTLISHEDLIPENIIIDNEYNIKGYITGFSLSTCEIRLHLILVN